VRSSLKELGSAEQVDSGQDGTLLDGTATSVCDIFGDGCRRTRPVAAFPHLGRECVQAGNLAALGIIHEHLVVERLHDEVVSTSPRMIRADPSVLAHGHTNEKILRLAGR
jgi:hypothetical protein